MVLVFKRVKGFLLELSNMIVTLSHLVRLEFIHVHRDVLELEGLVVHVGGRKDAFKELLNGRSLCILLGELLHDTHDIRVGPRVFDRSEPAEPLRIKMSRNVVK